MEGPSLQHLRAFRALAELMSFKRAGERLGVGGSAVSKLIANLEQDLGAQLFQRTTRTLTMTEAGAVLYDSVVRILDETELAVERLRDQGTQPHGQLRVSLPHSFGLRWVSRRVPDFLARYPHLTLDLSLNDRHVDLVAERYDCALRISSALPDSSLYARRIGAVSRVLVAAPRYLRHAPALNSPADLVHHRALFYAHSDRVAWPFVVDGRELAIPVNGRLKVDSSLMLRDALLAGMGLTLTPHFIVDDLIEAGQLISLLPTFLPATHGVYVVTSQRKHLPGKTRAWIEFIEQELQASGYGI
ncbi:LysR family transcriptional regulator [Dyella choica]|uniref:LysR family transcriptional regulator n=1 Tax=Dyella choica TaxID=1927959 RepID=A0A3S0PHX8_9GAMM|nr:LysR family transcriptional regulator [Dyella choica]RUL74477.1 LysR family transcriptional regulator [Dyella choica]